MKNFFSSLLASSIAIVVVGGIMITIAVIAIPAAIITGFADAETEAQHIDAHSVLLLDFKQEIGESYDAEFNPGSFKVSSKSTLMSMRKSLEKAAKDNRIDGLVLRPMRLSAGMHTTDEVYQMLAEFKKSGKFIYAYDEVYTQKGLYLSSLADSTFVYPEGDVEWKGLSTQVMFLKNMLAQFGVEMQVIRGKNNKYKAAVEPYLTDKMSDANKEQMEKIIFGFWNNMMDTIAKNKGVSIDSLNYFANHYTISSARKAVEKGLVDVLSYDDEFKDLITARTGVSSAEEWSYISLSKYKFSNENNGPAAIAASFDKEAEVEMKGNVGVVIASGEIVSGKSSPGKLGSLTIAKAIDDAAANDSVKVIVFRVNSPGGSALASDVIWRAVVNAKKLKPVIVSMGDLAASGGYYISCAADKIFAGPNTITGSIGVFGVLPNAQKLLENKLKLSFDGVKTNKYADIGSLNKPLSQEEYNQIQNGVEQVYHTFLTRVKDGRPALETTAEVDEIGQGRVWLGQDAVTLGLVDELGSYTDALAYAAELVGIAPENIETVVYPEAKQDKFIELISGLAQSGDMEALIKEEPRLIQEMSRLYEMYLPFMEHKGVVARLPFVVAE